MEVKGAEKTLIEAEKWLKSIHKVDVFYGDERADLKIDRNYLRLVNNMNEFAPEDVSKLTTVRFFSFLDHIQRKNENIRNSNAGR